MLVVDPFGMALFKLILVYILRILQNKFNHKMVRKAKLQEDAYPQRHEDRTFS